MIGVYEVSSYEVRTLSIKIVRQKHEIFNLESLSVFKFTFKVNSTLVNNVHQEQLWFVAQRMKVSIHCALSVIQYTFDNSVE